MDRYPDGPEGGVDRVSSDRPPPPEPTPPPTKEQIREAELSALRVQRNTLLAQTDWTQLPDSPLTLEQKAEATAYRKALRDAPGKKDLKLPDAPAFVLAR